VGFIEVEIIWSDGGLLATAISPPWTIRSSAPQLGKPLGYQLTQEKLGEHVAPETQQGHPVGPSARPPGDAGSSSRTISIGKLNNVVRRSRSPGMLCVMFRR
jgi:hypothetical protein